MNAPSITITTTGRSGSALKSPTPKRSNTQPAFQDDRSWWNTCEHPPKHTRPLDAGDGKTGDNVRADRLGQRMVPLTSSALFAIDQAITIGCRYQRQSSKLVSPLPTVNAQIHEARCAYQARHCALPGQPTPADPCRPSARPQALPSTLRA